MADDVMVTIRGVRYRVEDAKRLGLLDKPKVESKAKQPADKAAEPKNK